VLIESPSLRLPHRRGTGREAAYRPHVAYAVDFVILSRSQAAATREGEPVEQERAAGFLQLIMQTSNNPFALLARLPPICPSLD
jgi:hypothetical protein